MPFDYQTTLERIISKARLLEERYKILAEKKAAAEAELEELKKENALCKKRIHELETEAENLRIVATISPEREQVDATRSLLADLIRDIDRCINDLSEDA